MFPCLTDYGLPSFRERERARKVSTLKGASCDYGDEEDYSSTTRLYQPPENHGVDLVLPNPSADVYRWVSWIWYILDEDVLTLFTQCPGNLNWDTNCVRAFFSYSSVDGIVCFTYWCHSQAPKTGLDNPLDCSWAHSSHTTNQLLFWMQHVFYAILRWFWHLFLATVMQSFWWKLQPEWIHSV